MSLFREIAELEDEGHSFVVATVIDSAGSTPQKPGSRMVVLENGTTRGTVGGGAIEHQIRQAAAALFVSGESSRVIETHLTHDLGMCCGGKMKLFLERHGAAARLFIFGAGHVARPLAALATTVGFRVTVVDERAELLNLERFPTAAERLLEDPATVAAGWKGGDDHYACVTTHDHPLDQAVVEGLLRKPLRYLGVIGSRRKAERFRQRLLAQGFTEDELSSVRSPMGLPIDALTPEEIAVSVVAELIAVRRSEASSAVKAKAHLSAVPEKPTR